MGLRCGGDGFFNVLGVEQMIDGQNDNHPVFQRYQPADKSRIDLGIGGRRRFDVIGNDIENVGPAIYPPTDDEPPPPESEA